MLEFFVVFLAGLAGGALNAVAGGGTFLTFPALVWMGVPPVMANATATLCALPGYFGSTWAFRHDFKAEGPLGLKAIIAVSMLGGLLGSLLLLVTPGSVFTGIVPWLLALATVLFAAGPWLLGQLRQRGATAGTVVSALLVFAVSVYGGYFNGGLGIMLLAVFGLIGFSNLNAMNGLKNLLSSLLSLVSAVTYASAGLIAWDAALVLAVGTMVGGYLGAHYARKITRTDLLRLGIVAIGCVMTVVFFLR
ncbi:sulfite exporter TauE/SafE family protein [Phaeovulum sp. W22_SRMD_FR3]|uniref:sulfite exporter TauE/SafE family protein n=1 Tax=Phaeovulum sp. W22_SRMD_FR3 TaxID=3240274 RepID=UPI003F99B040